MKDLCMTERKILDFILSDAGSSPREIAKRTDSDENTARRLYNRLFQENVCSKVVIPNYALLGYNVMIVQKFTVKRSVLPDLGLFTARIVSGWDNCIDCHSTFDGKVMMRSVWRSTEEFRNARNVFHKRFGMDWLVSEELDMIPLSENRMLFAVKSLWGGPVGTD